jgi:hypothetical protein
MDSSTSSRSQGIWSAARSRPISSGSRIYTGFLAPLGFLTSAAALSVTSLMILPCRNTVPMSVRILATVRGARGLPDPPLRHAFRPGCVSSFVLKSISAAASISFSRRFPNSGSK